MRLEQQLEHVFVISLENHARCSSFRLSSCVLNNSWSMVCVCSLRLLSGEFHNSWNMVSVSTMRNHAPPILIKVE